jgi:arylsulfatase A
VNVAPIQEAPVVRRLIALPPFCVSFAVLVTATNAKAAPARPNIVVVLADDLGYGDLACFGHPVIKTPNLDRFAAEGLRLTSCYSASANCSPARTGLMTGRTPYRAGIHTAIPMLSPMHLRAEEVTVAKLLREAGYATCHSGKWHLNGMFNLSGPQPGDHGFDHWFSTQNNCLPNHHNPYNFARNGIPVGPLEGYASQLVADEAIGWLDTLKEKTQPFFLYVCFHEPHEPIRTQPRFESLYSEITDPSVRAYYGNVSQMDEAFGRLMRKLDELGQRDNTFVWFTSDNGPARTRWHTAGSPGPLREYKGHSYEGGIRVPGIIRWPGHVQAGTQSDEPICGVDLLPTVCAITEITPLANRPLDGTSILPLFEGQSVERKTPLYWQFNYSISEPKVAMRIGDWKVLAKVDAPRIV